MVRVSTIHEYCMLDFVLHTLGVNQRSHLDWKTWKHGKVSFQSAKRPGLFELCSGHTLGVITQNTAKHRKFAINGI